MLPVMLPPGRRRRCHSRARPPTEQPWPQLAFFVLLPTSVLLLALMSALVLLLAPDPKMPWTPISGVVDAAPMYAAANRLCGR